MRVKLKHWRLDLHWHCVSSDFLSESACLSKSLRWERILWWTQEHNFITLVSLTFCHCFSPSVCVSLHSVSNTLLSLSTLKKAPVAVPAGGSRPAGGAESGGAARQREAPGRRPEQSAVQLPEQRLQCREPRGQLWVFVFHLKGLRKCNNSWKWLKS